MQVILDVDLVASFEFLAVKYEIESLVDLEAIIIMNE